MLFLIPEAWIIIYGVLLKPYISLATVVTMVTEALVYHFRMRPKNPPLLPASRVPRAAQPGVIFPYSGTDKRMQRRAAHFGDRGAISQTQREPSRAGSPGISGLALRRSIGLRRLYLCQICSLRPLGVRCLADL